jgi:hypothetical protein
MILLAALLCNYGRGYCLIDVGTEGFAMLLAPNDQLLVAELGQDIAWGTKN